MVNIKGGYFRFGSVLIKKVIKLNFFKKKKTETGSNWPVSVWFFRTKTGSNRFGSVFFGLGSARFGFFRFRLIKPEPNRSIF
jgi:hypothetical protein